MEIILFPLIFYREYNNSGVYISRFTPSPGGGKIIENYGVLGKFFKTERKRGKGRKKKEKGKGKEKKKRKEKRGKGKRKRGKKKRKKKRKGKRQKKKKKREKEKWKKMSKGEKLTIKCQLD